MDIKPELQKTIKRLVSQKNYDVLKNKLRTWIATKELNIVDLIRQCREKAIFIPPIILNKIGMLFSSGKEGLNEEPDTAFMFYLLAADLGFPSANGNIATYYFNGRAPGGKNIQLAYQYCRKAIELGCDKFMLMSEILHEQRDYLETIRYVRKMMDNKQYSKSLDAKKKMDIRKLEINCLHEELRNRIFVKLFLNYHKTLLLENILAQLELSSNAKFFSYHGERSKQQSGSNNNNQILRSISNEDELFDFPDPNYFNQAVAISSPVPPNQASNNDQGNNSNNNFGPLSPLTGSSNNLRASLDSASRPKSPSATSSHSPLKRFDSRENMNEAKRVTATITIPTVPMINTNLSASMDSQSLQQRVSSPSAMKSPGLVRAPSLLIASLGTPKYGGNNNANNSPNNPNNNNNNSPAGKLSNSLTLPSPHYHPQSYKQIALSASSGGNNNLPPTAANLQNSIFSKDKAMMLYKQSLFQHQLPGWFFVTDELEGFDSNSCLELTAKAEMLTLESEVMKSATEYAKSYLSIQLPMKNPLFAQFANNNSTGNTSALLQSSYTTASNPNMNNNLYSNIDFLNNCLQLKLSEFELHSQQLNQSKNSILKLWNNYIDIQEHILRKQILTEKKFFNPLRNVNTLTFLLTKELLHRRLYDYNEYLNENNLYHNLFISLNEFCNDPLLLLNLTNKYYHFPYMRILLVAERSLLELSMQVYGRAPGLHRENNSNNTKAASSSSSSSSSSSAYKGSPGQRTGWTGKLNQYICDLDDVISHDTLRQQEAGNPVNIKSVKEYLLSEQSYLETIVIGSSVIRYSHKTYPILSEPSIPISSFHNHIPSLRGNHQSFLIMEDIYSSYDVLNFFNKITMVSSPAAVLSMGDNYDMHFLENERKLVDIILKFTSDGKPINLNDLQMINEDINEYECNYLMKICYFYFVKRLIPWILSIDSNDNDGSSSSDGFNDAAINDPLFHTKITHELPLATGQARALTLVKHGFLTFQELFELSSPYGIFYFDNTLPNADGSSSAQQQDFSSSPMPSGGGGGGEDTSTIGTSPTKKLKRKPSSSSLATLKSSAAGGNNNNNSNNMATVEPILPSNNNSSNNNNANNNPSASGNSNNNGNNNYQMQTFDLLRQQIININELYQKAILESSIDNYHPYIQFYKNHPHGKTVPSYKLCKQELMYCYGGDGDSDDEDNHSPDSKDSHNNNNNNNNRSAPILNKLENNDFYGSEDRLLELLLSQLKV